MALTELLRRHRKRILFTILFFFVAMGIWLAGVLVYTWGGYRLNRDATDAKILEWKHWLVNQGELAAPPAVLIYDRNGELIGEFLPERGSRISLHSCQAEMVWLKRAAVSGEDRFFYEHGGISWRGVFRAMLHNVLALAPREGGGSITQQVARNLFTDRSYSLKRKFLETFLAKDLEASLTKDEILCLYLNRIYMGEGRLGAEEASWFYFNKAPQYLTAGEAAMIVGLFPSPARYSPLNNLAMSLQKQRLVLEALVRDGHLKPADVDREIKRFQAAYQMKGAEDPGLVGAYGASRDFRVNRAPSANEAVREFLYENLPEEMIRAGGLRVHTTINLSQQTIALASARSRVAEVRQKTAAIAAKYGAGQNLDRGVNTVVLTIGVPDGEIRAMVGGTQVTEGGSPIQRIFAMRRQPGSAIKGFLYALALEEGIYTPYDRVKDEAINIGGYSPRNWYRSYKGEMPLRRAVALSVNTVAVKTINKMGVDYFRNQMARALELSLFETRERFEGNLSLGLGTGELTPAELARLYAIILNRGETVRPVLVRRIDDREGSVVWEEPTERSSVRILSEKAAAGALWLLEGVVDAEEDGTAGWIGRLRKKDPSYMPFDVAGKSGTTQSPPEALKRYHQMPGIRDSWFVGLIPGELTVVWLGHDRGAPFEGNAGVLWADYVSKSHAAIDGKFPDVRDYYGTPEGGLESFQNLPPEKPDKTEGGQSGPDRNGDFLNVPPAPEQPPGN